MKNESSQINLTSLQDVYAEQIAVYAEIIDALPQVAEWDEKKKSFAALQMARIGLPSDQAAIEAYLLKDESVSLPQPFELKDSKKAADIVEAAMRDNEKIMILGDFDADGISSTVQMVKGLEALGAEEVGYDIPLRSGGHGLTIDKIREHAENGYTTLIAVDKGISSFEEIEYAESLGMKVVVLDHHTQPEGAVVGVRKDNPNETREGIAIVDAHRRDDPTKHTEFSGASLVWNFLNDMNNERIKGALSDSLDADSLIATHFDLASIYPELSPLDMDELAALAAPAVVADVVPLVGANRYILDRASELWDEKKYPALATLMNIEQQDVADETTFGFKVGPLFNALNRAGDPMLMAKYLLSDDTAERSEMIKEIRIINEQRKARQNNMYPEVREAVQAFLDEHPDANFVMVEDANWDAGLVGPIASRIREEFGITAAVGSVNDNGTTGYSVRAMEREDFVKGGLNPITAAIESGTLQGYLGGGGHPAAAGFKIESDSKQAVFEVINNGMQEDRAKRLEAGEEILYFSELDLKDISLEKAKDIQNTFGPFGKENEKPTFLLKDVQVQHMRLMGKDRNHLRIGISDAGDDSKDRTVQEGVLFNINSHKAVRDELTHPERTSRQFDIAVELDINRYQGQERVIIHPKAIVNAKAVEQEASVKPLELSQNLEQLRESRTKEPDIKYEIADFMRYLEKSEGVIEHKPEIQAVLEVLYENKIAVFDLETGGLNAGADTPKDPLKANTISQIAALKVVKKLDENNQAYFGLEGFNKFVSPETPAGFEYKIQAERAKGRGEKPPKYNKKINEYNIDEGALDVTNTRYVRESGPDSPVVKMIVGNQVIEGDDLRPAYEVMPEFLEFLKDTKPVAYNAAFDDAVDAKHIRDIIHATIESFDTKKTPRTSIKEPWIREEFNEKHGKALGKALTGEDRLAQLDDIPLDITNPAHRDCAMINGKVQFGEFPSQRLQHVSPELYGINFEQDDTQHDAMGDILPMLPMLYEQLEANKGQLKSLKDHYQDLIQRFDPEATIDVVNREPDVEVLVMELGEKTFEQWQNDGRLDLEEKSNHAAITRLLKKTPDLEIKKVGDLREKLASNGSDAVMKEIALPLVEALGQKALKEKAQKGAIPLEGDLTIQFSQNESEKAQALKDFLFGLDETTRRSKGTYSHHTGIRTYDQEANRVTIAPRHKLDANKQDNKLPGMFDKLNTFARFYEKDLIEAFKPFNSSGKVDVVVPPKNKDDVRSEAERTIENVPFIAMRKSMQYLEANPEHFEDNIRMLTRLSEANKSIGMVVIEDGQVTIKGHQGSFGNLEFITPMGEPVTDYTNDVEYQLNFMMKTSVMPGVSVTTRGDLAGEELNEEAEDRLPAEPTTTIRLDGTRYTVQEVKPQLMEEVAGEFDIDLHELPTQITSGITLSLNEESGLYVLEGKQEAFEEINLPLRDHAWLTYRLTQLPNTLKSESSIDDGVMTIKQYPELSLDTMAILDRAHVEYTATKDTIELDLNTMVGDAFHWGQEIRKEIDRYKEDRPRKGDNKKFPPAAHLEVLHETVTSEKIDSFFINRSGHVWVDGAANKNVRLKREDMRIEVTDDGRIDFGKSSTSFFPNIKGASQELNYAISKLSGLDHVAAHRTNYDVDTQRVSIEMPTIRALQRVHPDANPSQNSGVPENYAEEMIELAKQMQLEHLYPLQKAIKALKKSNLMDVSHHLTESELESKNAQTVTFLEDIWETIEQFNQEVLKLLEGNLEFKNEKHVEHLFGDAARMQLMVEAMRNAIARDQVTSDVVDDVADIAEKIDAVQIDMSKADFLRNQVKLEAAESTRRISDNNAQSVQNITRILSEWYVLKITQANQQESEARDGVIPTPEIGDLGTSRAADAYKTKLENLVSKQVETVVSKEGELVRQDEASQAKDFKKRIKSLKVEEDYPQTKFNTALNNILDNLEESVFKLNQSLHHNTMVATSETLSDKKIHEVVAAGSQHINTIAKDNVVRTLQTLKAEGLTDNITLEQNEKGNWVVSFDAEVLLQPEWQEYVATRISELNAGKEQLPEKEFLLVDNSSLLSLLLSYEDLPNYDDQGLLGLITDLSENDVVTPIITDANLGEFFGLPFPVNLDDVQNPDNSPNFPKMPDRLRFIENLIDNAGGVIMKTKTADNVFDVIRNTPALQQKWEELYPDAKSLAESSNEEIKALALAGDNQSYILRESIRSTKQADVPMLKKQVQSANGSVKDDVITSDRGEISIGDAVIELQEKYGKQVPIRVLGEGNDVRAQMLARISNTANDDYFILERKHSNMNPNNKSFHDPKNRSNVLALGNITYTSTPAFIGAAMNMAKSVGRYIISPNEMPDNQAVFYNHNPNDPLKNTPDTSYQGVYKKLQESQKNLLGNKSRLYSKSIDVHVADMQASSQEWEKIQNGEMRTPYHRNQFSAEHIKKGTLWNKLENLSEDKKQTLALGQMVRDAEHHVAHYETKAEILDTFRKEGNQKLELLAAAVEENEITKSLGTIEFLSKKLQKTSDKIGISRSQDGIYDRALNQEKANIARQMTKLDNAIAAFSKTLFGQVPSKKNLNALMDRYTPRVSSLATDEQKQQLQVHRVLKLMEKTAQAQDSERANVMKDVLKQFIQVNVPKSERDEVIDAAVEKFERSKQGGLRALKEVAKQLRNDTPQSQQSRH